MVVVKLKCGVVVWSSLGCESTSMGISFDFDKKFGAETFCTSAVGDNGNPSFKQTYSLHLLKVGITGHQRTNEQRKWFHNFWTRLGPQGSLRNNVLFMPQIYKPHTGNMPNLPQMPKSVCAECRSICGIFILRHLCYLLLPDSRCKSSKGMTTFQSLWLLRWCCGARG